jgi:hypothetical protein
MDAEKPKQPAVCPVCMGEGKLWCAMCGTWGNHRSGGCPELAGEAAAESDSAPNERGTRSLERVGRLCARWRAESERIWKAANGYPEEKDRIRADTLDSAADELELEIGAAGAEPTHRICED